MTFAPASIQKAQRYVHDKTGVSWNGLGIVGDKNHRGGYHCGRDRVDDDDYSVDESPRDREGLSYAASALDIGYWSGLRKFSIWLVAQCEANTPDTRQDVRVTGKPAAYIETGAKGNDAVEGDLPMGRAHPQEATVAGRDAD